MPVERFQPGVVIVDDDVSITECVAQWLTQSQKVRVVAVASHAQQGVALAIEHAPEVVLLGVPIFGADPFWACQEIRRLMTERVRVLFYTGSPCDHYLDMALAAGASGMASRRTETMASLVTAIRHVARGATYFSAELAGRLVALDGGAVGSRLTTLSHREIQVLRLLAQGKTNREVGTSLRISLRSVEKEVADMKQKLDVPSTNALLVFAARERLVDTHQLFGG